MWGRGVALHPLQTRPFWALFDHFKVTLQAASTSPRLNFAVNFPTHYQKKLHNDPVWKQGGAFMDTGGCIYGHKVQMTFEPFLAPFELFLTLLEPFLGLSGAT